MNPADSELFPKPEKKRESKKLSLDFMIFQNLFPILGSQWSEEDRKAVEEYTFQGENLRRLYRFVGKDFSQKEREEFVHSYRSAMRIDKLIDHYDPDYRRKDSQKIQKGGSPLISRAKKSNFSALVRKDFNFHVKGILKKTRRYSARTKPLILDGSEFDISSRILAEEFAQPLSEADLDYYEVQILQVLEGMNPDAAEVFRLLMEGYENKQIAEMLQCDERTVRRRRDDIKNHPEVLAIAREILNC